MSNSESAAPILVDELEAGGNIVRRVIVVEPLARGRVIDHYVI